MLKQIELRYGGAPAKVAGQDILRILPNRFVDCIGPFTYLEPIEAGGPFVMNTKEELTLAYRDYGTGKYGSIKYNN
jgi:hypothetical protein